MALDKAQLSKYLDKVVFSLYQAVQQQLHCQPTLSAMQLQVIKNKNKKINKQISTGRLLRAAVHYNYRLCRQTRTVLLQYSNTSVV